MKDMMWSTLFHLGRNFSGDTPAFKKGDNPVKCFGFTEMDFDEAMWREAVERMKEGGVNTVVLDLSEGVVYPSHPELAVKGSWSPEKLKGEVERLGKMGIEVIPKLNFSTCHDTWLGEYGRMVSTKPYYRACSEIIADVFDIFGKARFFHLGYDEETVSNQRDYLFTCVRHGELWWHDFLFFVKEVEKHGARAWMWSDYMWDHEEEFLRRMPRSVLQSNWYYGTAFMEEKDPHQKTRASAYALLEKAGFDQLPTGSNCYNNQNLGLTVPFCRKIIAPERLKGFMTAPWCATRPDRMQKLINSIDQLMDVK